MTLASIAAIGGIGFVAWFRAGPAVPALRAAGPSPMVGW